MRSNAVRNNTSGNLPKVLQKAIKANGVKNLSTAANPPLLQKQQQYHLLSFVFFS